ncbi:Glycosyltransferase involved in cell wall bisynthesis [Flavobacterium resistens]|uniref:Glycosyltransferase n=1 Tax=Flavobacterium resistens TaxID=443612 RepID=A0A521BJM2_9FLAO|nr:glycosyltransferase family 4 protein [Flavobacterium resistens]MRX67430.1 glycosyltransferase [Flavobacterium resistens]SMO47295.1 Glycosyltransferase involved in cell wall bisynthesis [Flavobacterium resistens]
MRLLYIVPKIKNAGGVARVLLIKANYFVENFGYEVHVLSQNEKKDLPFYDFNSEVIFHDMTLKGNVFQFLKSYQKQVNKAIQEIKPDIILIADNGLKAFVFPFIVKTKSPIVFEIHGSKFIEEKAQKTDFISKSIQKIKYRFKDFSVRKFTKIVALSEESRNEWKAKNAIVIPNPSWIKTEKTADLKNKKVIAIARNSYEKGLFRLLIIWKKITKKHSDWTLDIYTDEVDALQIITTDLKLDSNINIFGFVKNIEEKYSESSIYAMTSRSEGFPMVLLEAMASGLPCIAFDCPIGPKTIIKNGENGFLIPENDSEMYVEKFAFLMENEELRFKLGTNAKATSEKYSVDKIMEQWRQFLEKL